MLSLLDLAVIGIYLLLCIAIGVLAGGKPTDSISYFKADGTIPWWASSFSVVATETSLLTVISIPVVAYGGSLVFLQLVIGYIIGRILVAWLILPSYFKGNLTTPYGFFLKRYGSFFRKLSSILFLITRLLADGVRLFAAAIPLKMVTGLDYPTAIAIIALLTLVYTYWGGIRSVIWIDVLQLFVYTFSAFVVLYYVTQSIEGAIFSTLIEQGKTVVFQLPSSFQEVFFTPYNLVGALIGGIFLTMASHGTDHIIVQRLLACGDLKKARLALISSGFLVFFQFLLFLTVGLMVYLFYSGASFTVLGLNNPDEILIHFVVNNIPTGFIGLFIAALFAAAMSTLSSSLSALSSSTIFDLFPKLALRRDALQVSRFMMVIWTLIFVAFASLFTDTNNPVIEIGLSIAGFTYGALLGAFIMGIYSKITTESAVTAFLITLITMAFIIFFSELAWPWFTPIGFSIYAVTASLFHVSIPNKKRTILYED